MRALSRASIIVVALAVFSCVTAQPRSKLAIRRVESALDAFADARHEYPRTLDELSTFAAASGHPLDFTPFAKITLKRHRRSRVTIYIETRDRPSEPTTLTRVTTS
jgi:hypothetical protein